MTLMVNWYAANPGLHPIPVGYGLPWGTKDEKKIPQWIRLEAERTLAREQLATQTPDANDAIRLGREKSKVHLASQQQPSEEADKANSSSNSQFLSETEKARIVLPNIDNQLATDEQADSQTELARMQARSQSENLPVEWPDPQGFVPPAPLQQRPMAVAQYEPVITHMKAYNGNDEDFTEALADHYYFRDDARFGGWQAYLQRSEDFIRFCCHQHVIESLGSRGGQLKSKMIVRWPIDRYDR